MPNQFAELPHCIGTEAMNENKGWLTGFVRFGYPAMHGGSIAEVGGDGAEAGDGEGMAV